MGDTFGTKILNEALKSEKPKKVKQNLMFYKDDWFDFVKFRNYKIMENKNPKFSYSDTLAECLKIISKDYDGMITGNKKVRMKAGRRASNNEKETIHTTVDLSHKENQFFLDIIYHNLFTLGRVELSKAELLSEIVAALKENYPKIYKDG